MKSFGAADLRTFLKANYGAKRMVLSAAGKVDHDQLVRHAEALFGGMNGGAGGRFEPARYVGGTRTSAKPFEQSHLLHGVRGPVVPRAGVLRRPGVLVAFGGGMSSRLFQEVRERRGLCYAIYSSCWALADTGLFGIHAATGPEMMGKLIEVVAAELLPAPRPRSRPKPSWRAPRRSSRPAC